VTSWSTALATREAMMLDSVELHVVPARHLRRIVARVSRNWRRR
jgi:hypothetical protein